MMATFYGLCLALILVMRFAPQSPLGRWLNRNFVEEPFVRLAKFERHRLIYVLLLASMMMAGGEMIVLLGPEFLATYAVYLDAAAVTAVLAIVARVRSVAQVLRSRMVARAMPKPKRAARRRRTRAGVRKLPAKSANDDDPAPGLASFGFHLAAA